MTKKIAILISIIILGLAVGLFRWSGLDRPKSKLFFWEEQRGEGIVAKNNSNSPSPGEISTTTVIASNLEIPWDIAFLPDGRILISERPGRLLILEKDGEKKLIYDEDVRAFGEGGLLGITRHPDFKNNHYVYLYLAVQGSGEQTENRVERYRFEEGALVDRTTIIEGIPGALYHDGGRLEFGPDGLLYITTGDATQPRIAQNLNSLGGKILRLRDDGKLPSNNPFGNAVYSYGHRNSQGLTWDNRGKLWSTEHGRSGVLSGLDEINLIQAGANYGWPNSEGGGVMPNTIGPVLHSGTDTTWAPASAAYYNGSIFFGGLRGEALYEAVIDGERVAELKAHFYKEFGRIRTVRLGPDDMLYITTSNRDGRGTPRDGDDKIIRINPKLLK